MRSTTLVRPASPPTPTVPPVAARTVAATKVYGAGDTEVTALDAVTVEFAARRFTAIMGPSGSGKSTLMHCIAGLDWLSSGRAFIGETDLSTLGDRALTRLRRDKVGFTVTGKTKEGQPVYINGVRGMVERNAMRYYLAIEAYFGAMSAPTAQQQQEKRLHDWFALTEEHPRQLHEMERMAKRPLEMLSLLHGAQRQTSALLQPQAGLQRLDVPFPHISDQPRSGLPLAASRAAQRLRKTPHI